MSANLGRILAPDEIEALEHGIIEDAEAGREAAAWRKAQALRKTQPHQPEAAKALLRIVERQCLPADRAVDVLSEIAQSHRQDAAILSMLGECLEAVRDIDDLNAPPPGEPVFRDTVDRLAALAEDNKGGSEEEAILRGLATAARMCARQYDGIAEMSYKRLVAIDPQDSAWHYNLGLFFKTRGRFAEGMEANREAARLAGEPSEGCEWNLGICATGAGEGAAALEVWKRMEQIIEMGRFGLPEGGYPQCKVRLAERPLAERGAGEDDPGLEETVWIERLSPCHGIVRSVLYQDLGVDYGDVILMDGAPVTYHTYGDTKVPVFPHLATLLRRGYRIFDFAGTQDGTGRLADASTGLEGDAIVYSHSENFQILCAGCWRDPDLDHEHHESMEKHVVTGRIAAPADTDPGQLLDQLDRAVAERSPCQLYAPDLCRAAGQQRRAEVDERRFDLLRGN